MGFFRNIASAAQAVIPARLLRACVPALLVLTGLGLHVACGSSGGGDEGGATITQHTITASAGTGGTITPSGAVKVDAGTNKAFTITPASGYTIAAVTVDGANKGAITTYTFSNVQAAHTIAATFAVISTTQHTITASAGTGGTITPAGATSVNEGASQTYTFTPASGYVLEAITVDGVGVSTTPTYTFTNVQAAHTIAATFTSSTGLVWNDEFDAAAVETAKWDPQIGRGPNNDAFGTWALDYCTANAENLRTETGDLVINVKKDSSHPGASFTSARVISTKQFNPGSAPAVTRIVARIKMPSGSLMWPAFLLLGDMSGSYGSWPTCGEMDIVELFCGTKGNGMTDSADPRKVSVLGDNAVFSTFHWGPSPTNAWAYGGHVDLAKPLAEDYHLFWMEWSQTGVTKFYVDKVQVGTGMGLNTTTDYTKNLALNYFNIILNVAVGVPPGSKTYTASEVELTNPIMRVDYVRVFDASVR